MITSYGKVTVDEEGATINGFSFDGYTPYREVIEWAISRMKADLATTGDQLTCAGDTSEGEEVFSPAQYVAAMADDDLVDWMVADQVRAVHLLRAWAHNPLGQPPLTPASRARVEAAWAECWKRGLAGAVSERVAQTIPQRAGKEV